MTGEAAIPAFGSCQPSWWWRLRYGGEARQRRRAVDETQLRKPRIWLRRHPQVCDTRFAGLNLRLHPAENLCDLTIVLTGDHPLPGEFARLRARWKQVRTCVDIGGNIGLYALLAWRHMPEGGRILTFEPDPDTAAKMRVNIALNPGAGETIEVIEAAAGPADETRDLYSPKRGNAGRHTLVPDNEAAVATGAQVRVTTLLSALESRGITSIDLLKIDVEGFEAEALAPFFAAAPQSLWPKYLIMETVYRHLWSPDLTALLPELGYALAFEDATDAHYALPEDTAAAPVDPAPRN